MARRSTWLIRQENHFDWARIRRTLYSSGTMKEEVLQDLRSLWESRQGLGLLVAGGGSATLAVWLPVQKLFILLIELLAKTDECVRATLWVAYFFA